MIFDEFREGWGQGARRHLSDDLRDVADSSLLLGVSVFFSRWHQQFADIFIPDALHLAALHALALLLGGDEGHEFVAHAFISDLSNRIVPWQVFASKVAEVARDEHTRGEQSFGRISATKLAGAFLKAVGQPEDLTHRHGDAEQLTEPAHIVVVEFGGRGFRESDDVIETHHGLPILSEISEHLVINLHREVGRHLLQFHTHLGPIPRDEAQEEAVIRRQGRGISGANALKVTQQLARVAGELLFQDRLVFLEQLWIRPRWWSGNSGSRFLGLRSRE